MPTIRNLVTKIAGRRVVFQAPYYIELVHDRITDEYGDSAYITNGRLPRDIEAHALWHYFCVASLAFRTSRENLVEDSELSVSFKPDQIFRSIAQQYQVSPTTMGNYWPIIEIQRIALGLTNDDDIPTQFKYRGLLL